jgi:predicted ribosomally synthesized peptide with nif11-like leader
MSKEAAKAFVEKMKADKAFRRRVMAVADATARLKLAKNEGFDFSMEELKAVQRGVSKQRAAGDVEGQDCCYGFDGCRA